MFSVAPVTPRLWWHDICIHWLDMYYGVPDKSPNQQIVPLQSFPLSQGFQNFQCSIGLDVCCGFVLLTELSMKRILEFAWG